MLARIVIALGAALLLSIAMAGAQRTPHAQHHDQYQDWKTIGGSSCCNNNDCKGAEGYRLTPNGYEALIHGEYFAVPPAAIRPYPSPDGGAHICYRDRMADGRSDPLIICFVRPMGV